MPALDAATLKALIPFDEMSDDALTTILAAAEIIEVDDGKMVFKRDEHDEFVYWLLTGSVDLLDARFAVTKRHADEAMAQFPLENSLVHAYTAVSTSLSTLLKVKRADVSQHAPSFAAATEEEEEEEEEEGIDWMSTLLSSPLFEFIPPANIQTLFGKFEEVEFEKGETVIRQGDPGDYFYVIQKGRARVERSVGDKTTPLAELRAGNNFGQDALVSDVPRNATVTMLSRGTLMRLSEPDFEALLMNPVIETLNLDEVQEMVDAGEPKTYVLDVRNPKEIGDDKIPGALNVPLLALRKNLRKLKADAVYVTASGTNKRAELAAYILNENGFTAYVLHTRTDTSADA